MKDITIKTPSKKEKSLASRFTALERHRRYLLALVDNDWIQLTPLQLLNYTQFRAVAIGKAGVYLPPCPKSQWEALVKQRVEETGGESLL